MVNEKDRTEISLRRRIFGFFSVTGVTAVILYFIPRVHRSIIDWISLNYDLTTDVNNNLVQQNGNALDPGLAANISLLSNFVHVLKLVLWMIIVIAVVRLIASLIWKRTQKGSNQRVISSLLETMVFAVIYIVAFFIIFQTQFPKVALTPLITGSAIIGIVVGLALQDTLGNLFSGIALQADQSFQVGDIISIQNHGGGTVESISWRGIKIRTFQDRLLVMSNSVVGKETIEVARQSELNARIVRFNTIYTNSPARVIQKIRETVRKVENVSPKHRPKVRAWNLGDNGMDWEVKYWITNYRQFNDTDALIRQRIWYAFNREGFDFAYPTRTIYTAKQSEQEKVFVQTEDEICERLNAVAIFAPLSDEETAKISKTCNVRVFAPGESIIQIGQPGKSMYVVHRGAVNIQVTENGTTKTISTLHEGDFFGEMSLFTGEPRTANVVAETETKVLEIAPYVIKPILEKNPDVANIISEIIEERRELLEAVEEEIAVATEAKQNSVLGSIKRFLGIE